MNQDTNGQDHALLAPGRVALSVAEAAIAVGLSQRTLWTNVRAGKIRVARVGTRVLILKSDLETWLSGLADTSGARHEGKDSCSKWPPLGETEERIERSYRSGYWSGFDEGSESVLSDHATKEDINNLYNKIMDWAQGDCSNYQDPPKLERSNG